MCVKGLAGLAQGLCVLTPPPPDQVSFPPPGHRSSRWGWEGGRCALWEWHGECGKRNSKSHGHLPGTPQSPVPPPRPLQPWLPPSLPCTPRALQPCLPPQPSLCPPVSLQPYAPSLARPPNSLSLACPPVSPVPPSLTCLPVTLPSLTYPLLHLSNITYPTALPSLICCPLCPQSPLHSPSLGCLSLSTPSHSCAPTPQCPSLRSLRSHPCVAGNVVDALGKPHPQHLIMVLPRSLGQGTATAPCRG